MLTKFPAFQPPEDLLLAALRPLEDKIPGLKVRATIENDLTVPYVMARAATGSWNSDSFKGSDNRFARRCLAEIHTFVEDPDGDTKGMMLQELVFQELYSHFTDQTVFTGIGTINQLRISTPAHRSADWAPSTGVNQYANLPRGMHRHQATYGLVVRPDKRAQITADEMIAIISG